MKVEPCITKSEKADLTWDEMCRHEGVYACEYSSVRFIVLKVNSSKGPYTTVLHFTGKTLEPALSHVWDSHKFKKLDETVRVSVG